MRPVKKTIAAAKTISPFAIATTMVAIVMKILMFASQSSRSLFYYVVSLVSDGLFLTRVLTNFLTIDLVERENCRPPYDCL